MRRGNRPTHPNSRSADEPEEAQSLAEAPYSRGDRDRADRLRLSGDGVVEHRGAGLPGHVGRATRLPAGDRGRPN